jgi:hypothetical protein
MPDKARTNRRSTTRRRGNSKVSNLGPLKGMSLEEIRVTPKNISKQVLDVPRNMKSLKTIGSDLNDGWPAAEFWARHETGKFK